ncbi:5'-AMP-activated protein kinase subunit gamma-1 [Schistosoma haematobium]|uniref:5'-AMP-activated protein kinase subunit gamma-1 n=2 Tax=Schistosoma haematobium TaxID=6185 RepID=A0A922IP94_SCHHA|nr:5'-AMP-activated protein kinase subunit gamma-1 [Schistosoma haematobium]KAH9583934.1 5'-AMP-activated protein kinase subunit gamma-1 [Schistosoma haematobium]CAH8570143.1 unnamed protein product [Schistosoma haematobium]CAH8576647.1 unnamed protein product [Schistosoma haematobium]
MECPNKLTRSGEELEELTNLIKRNKSDDVNSLVFYNQDGRPNSMLTVEPLEPEKSSYYVFLKYHTCYDLLPESAKLVVLDTKLSIKKAFYALIYNNVRAAILWDSSKQSYSGILTITDFIKVLVTLYPPDSGKMDEFEESSISSWREINTNFTTIPLVHVTPECSLLDASKMLLQYRFHRLPIIDTLHGNALHILTHKRILKYLHLNRHNLPPAKFISKSLHELKLGTYIPNVQTITNNTTIIEALKLFLKNQVSCLPVVNDEDGQLIEIYAKFDVINLAITRSYNNLNVCVYDALEFRRLNRDRYPTPLTCLKTDSLQDVMVKIVESGVHRLIIVDENNKVEGIISLSDILKFLTNWSTDDNHHHNNNNTSKRRTDLVRIKKFITNPLRNSYHQ